MNKPQLFCFTYADGKASFFDEIEYDLQEVELVKLEYSGHGIRFKESLYEFFDELVDDMYDRLIEVYKGNGYGLFWV